MARVYSASGSHAITSTETILSIMPAATSAIQILSIQLGQTSDAGDSEAEMATAQLNRISADGTGTTMLARPHEVGDGADATVEDQHTVDATVSAGPVVAEAFNVQAGWFYNPIPEERITLSPGGDGLELALAAAPADGSFSMQYRITWAEIG
jgi:hypothetical protein